MHSSFFLPLHCFSWCSCWEDSPLDSSPSCPPPLVSRPATASLRVSLSSLLFLSLQRQIYSSRPRRTSISFRSSFSISGWIQNQKFLWTGGKRRQAGKTGARDGWRRVDVESVMCGCVDVLIWSPLTFCENMNKWSGDTVCVCIALLLFLSSRLLDGDLLLSDLLLHSLVHLFLHPFTWWII